ncbi:PKD domain-containing protein [Marinospirillum perlucidum]|uniref:PKD domain-containing protein n=1 Tax=Marinospirillum perlucidum TaxID=1982602 RepID=UPI000DF3A6FE|nr:PKD domain-containing protein [Marinospirillum perlucidum]
MKINRLPGFLFLLAASLLMSGCFSESGTPYQQPDTDTDPVASISFNSQTILPGYLTFSDSSAELQVTMGSQTLDLGIAAENRLIGFGGFNYDVVWRQSVMEDSRGIKGVRMGYYRVEQNSNEFSQPSFHFLARDEGGNIFLTETFDMKESEEEALPYRQPEPALFMPAEASVGDSWLAGPSMVPWFYDFGEGWVATLVDDQARAPVSGIENTVQIKFHKKNYAYYMYFKSGLGVVEWLNSWEEDPNGKIKPIDGYAMQVLSTPLPGSDFTGTGWSDNQNAAIGAFVSGYGYLLDAGLASYTNSDSVTFPANDSSYTYYWLKKSLPSDHDASDPWLSELYIPYQPDSLLQRFSDYSASGSIQPQMTVLLDGKTYQADPNQGEVNISWLYPYDRHNHNQLFLLSGTLVNASDATDERQFAFQVSSIFYPHTQSDNATGIIVHGLNTENSFNELETGQTFRIYYSGSFKDNSQNDIATRDRLYYGFSEDAITNELTDSWWCFSTLQNGLCNNVNRMFAINVDIDPARVYMQIASENSLGQEIYRSDVFSLPIIADSGEDAPGPKARILDAFPEYIRGSLSNGSFDLGTLNALASSAAPGHSIVQYSWSFDGQEGSSDNPPVGGHSFTANGEYEIVLKVTDSQGKTDVARRRVVVSDQGTFILRNVGNEYASGYIGIYDKDGDLEYYDYYRYYFLYSGESQEIKLQGNKNYGINYFQSGEVVERETRYLGKGAEELLELNMDAY